MTAPAGTDRRVVLEDYGDVVYAADPDGRVLGEARRTALVGERRWLVMVGTESHPHLTKRAARDDLRTLAQAALDAG